MKKTVVYHYFYLGTVVRYLQDASTGHYIHAEGCILHNINKFFSYIKDYDLKVTERSASKLEEIKTELEKIEDKNAKLSNEQATKLQEVMKYIRHTVDAEISGFNVYTVSPKRIDVKRLMDDVPSLFSPGVFASLPEIAAKDFTAAGSCIAFALPTAAAFHILRGTEAVLRNFYFSLIKQKRTPDLLWGPIVQDMRKRTKTKKYTILYNHLDSIRSNFRNPTQHPELTYDINEVQDLWAICVEVLNRMAKILIEH